jgi:hypothetical protein
MKSFFSLLAGIVVASGVGAQPALTIYNQNFAVVRERVPLDLKAGLNVSSFVGVTTQLEPDSVVLRDPAGKVPLQILEQSYRADVMSQGFLLSLNEGKELDFLVRDQNGRENVVRGKVIRSGYVPGMGMTNGLPAAEPAAPIVEVEGRLRFSLPGEPVFPALASDGILKPTLTWQIGMEKAAKVDAELGYVTGGMSWQAAYNFIAPEKGDALDVVGWVTIGNQTGKVLENATVKLMAGNVNRVEPPQPRDFQRLRGEVQLSAFSVGGVTEKAFDEFHLYGLPRPVTLRDRETKQVEFMRASGIKAPVIYVYESTKNPTKVAVMREFKNSEENHLGMPLPTGRIRVYRRDDADGRLEFVGEDNIEHTPKNELVRIRTGDAFDVVAERTATNQNSSRFQGTSEQAYEIKLRNRKTEPVEVRVVEKLYGPNWTIIEKSDEFTKKDAQTIEFRVKLDPDQVHVLDYRVRYEQK